MTDARAQRIAWLREQAADMSLRYRAALVKNGSPALISEFYARDSARLAAHFALLADVLELTGAESVGALLISKEKANGSHK
jgi:hypothetical protein